MAPGWNPNKLLNPQTIFVLGQGGQIRSKFGETLELQYRADQNETVTGVVRGFRICSTLNSNVSLLSCLVIEIELIREREGILRKMERLAVY